MRYSRQLRELSFARRVTGVHSRNDGSTGHPVPRTQFDYTRPVVVDGRPDRLPAGDERRVGITSHHRQAPRATWLLRPRWASGGTAHAGLLLRAAHVRWFTPSNRRVRKQERDSTNAVIDAALRGVVSAADLDVEWPAPERYAPVWKAFGAPTQPVPLLGALRRPARRSCWTCGGPRNCRSNPRR